MESDPPWPGLGLRRESRRSGMLGFGFGRGFADVWRRGSSPPTASKRPFFMLTANLKSKRVTGRPTSKAKPLVGWALIIIYAPSRSHG
jgi:hypothetical protein